MPSRPTAGKFDTVCNLCIYNVKAVISLMLHLLSLLLPSCCLLVLLCILLLGHLLFPLSLLSPPLLLSPPNRNLLTFTLIGPEATVGKVVEGGQAGMFRGVGRFGEAGRSDARPQRLLESQRPQQSYSMFRRWVDSFVTALVASFV